MMKASTLFLMTALWVLTACQQPANHSSTASTPVQAASTAPTASLASAPKVTGNVKDYYLKSCVASALQNRPQDPKNTQIAQSICQCAYDAGVAEYGNRAADFDAAVKNSFEHPEKVDEKLLAISDKTIQACMMKHSSK